MRRLAHAFLRVGGWRFHGELPPVPKMIVVGAPHTSNWDFVVFLGALHHFGIEARYLAKHTLFRRPFRCFFQRLGGIPVDRSGAHGVVAQVVDEFAEAEELVLVIAPEGTRHRAPHWRSGFLAMAEGAGVPIVLAGIDYPSRTATIGEAVHFDGDVAGFMDRARRFYAGMRGKRPDWETPVVLDAGPPGS